MTSHQLPEALPLIPKVTRKKHKLVTIVSVSLCYVALVAIAIFLIIQAVNHRTQPSSIVNLGYAQYQGRFDPENNVTEFLGIRYAAPPLGDLRFSAPQKPSNEPGIQLADTQPPSCIQSGIGTAPTNPFSKQTNRESFTLDGRLFGVEGSEDCLFLNVYTPGDSISTVGLPTIVWIHGGGYVNGGAPAYPGTDLLRASGNRIVAVIIQYRLGLFGFLPGSAVKAGGILNAGLLDQEFALRWVQSHISKFGGDPTKVTIWGESAGAGSVLQHVIARNGQTNPQLFRAAITSSTYLPPQYAYNERIPEALYNEVVTQTDCSSSSDTLACIRQADVELLAAANANISANGFFGTCLFVPVVDGTFISQRPTEALKQGMVNGDALLAIVNSNEGNMFVDQSKEATVNTAVYAAQLFPEIESREQQEIADHYAELGTPLDQVNTIMGEAIFTCPTYSLLSAFPNSYKGEFALPPALHSMDIAYYFTSWGPVFKNSEFMTSFSQSFISFAISLDPNVKFDPTNITPQWNRFRAGQTEMVFNRTEDGSRADIHTILTDPNLLERCRFWEDISRFTGQ